MKFSFVIPSYNHYDLLHQLLWDIYKNCSTPHEVIIVDDASSQESFLDGLSWWMENGMLPVKHIRPIENLGFLKASNKGLKEATGDIVCLVSTDVRIYKDLVIVAAALPEIEKRNQGKVLLGGRYFTQSTGWNEFDGKIFPYVEGWLLITSNDGWKELGYFDEQYVPHDFEDVDLSTTAISKGFSLAQITPDAGDVVTHIGAQTIGYNPEREGITQRNRKIFEKKWMK